MTLKVSTNNGILDIGNDENPLKCTAQSNVQCKEPVTIGCYRRVIDSLQTEIILVVVMVGN